MRKADAAGQDRTFRRLRRLSDALLPPALEPRALAGPRIASPSGEVPAAMVADKQPAAPPCPRLHLSSGCHTRRSLQARQPEPKPCSFCARCARSETISSLLCLTAPDKRTKRCHRVCRRHRRAQRVRARRSSVRTERRVRVDLRASLRIHRLPRSWSVRRLSVCAVDGGSRCPNRIVCLRLCV